MNMKHKNKYSTWFGVTVMLLMISSCDGFLDKMPDNRTSSTITKKYCNCSSQPILPELTYKLQN